MWTGITPSPDPGFVRKLKEYDPTLDIHFDRNYERFVITQLGKISGRVTLMVVNTPGAAHYRQPDERDLAAIGDADMHRCYNRGFKEIMRGGEEYLKEQRANQFKETDSDIRDVTKDNKLQLVNNLRRINNDGKPGSEFRRVVPGPKKTDRNMRRFVKVFK